MKNIPDPEKKKNEIMEYKSKECKQWSKKYNERK